MIFYFSGTGNSRWVAQRLAALTGDPVESIPDRLAKSPESVQIAPGDRVGLVFPVYAWGAPEIVERFCARLSVPDGAYAYAVCTCGDEAGRALVRLRGRFAYHAAWSVAMPNNYIPMYDLDDEPTMKRKAAAAYARTAGIAESVRKKERVYDVHAGSAAGLKTGLFRPAFNAFARNTKPFYAGDDCNACSLCEKNCPVGAIRMRDGKPVWVKKCCAQCMACISRCPKRCIQYGDATKSRGRYFFTERLLETGDVPAR